MFGGELALGGKTDTAATGPNIHIHIDLKDPKNKVINFTRLAEEKYGFAALYPRQAAQRERLARVAAAGAALERSASGSKMNSAGESGDDEGSVDIDRDSDNDGDIAMGGVNGEVALNSGTDAEPKKRKKRTRKAEEYDLDDDFVDDSEQVWEAQAATSKEGFFVYCGPLVAEGEKPMIERYVPSCFPGYYVQLTLSTEPMGRSSVAEAVVEAADLARVVEEDQEPRLRLHEKLHLCHPKSDPNQDQALEAARSCDDQELDWCLKTIVNMYNSRVVWRMVRRMWPSPSRRWSMSRDLGKTDGVDNIISSGSCVYVNGGGRRKCSSPLGRHKLA
jgi:hypothetical protein